MSEVYFLENDILKIKVMTLGATLMSLYDKKHQVDLVGGFDTPEEYLQNSGIFFGATVGRCANRIKDGEFIINGVKYHTLINNGTNSLHGGSVPFSFEEFKVLEKSDNSISFEYFSKDNEAGYPGNLTLKVTYELKENNVIISYSGISDKDTLFNITNHTYFNLSGGKKDILEDELYIPSERINLTDESAMALEEELDVKGTAFDFNSFRKIGDALLKGHQNMFGGIDHNFIQENNIDDLKAAIRNEKICVKVHSDLPDVQIYTGNYFDGFKARDSYNFYKHYAVAIEPQYVPNAINFSKYKKPLLKANKQANHYIKYVVED